MDTFQITSNNSIIIMERKKHVFKYCYFNIYSTCHCNLHLQLLLMCTEMQQLSHGKHNEKLREDFIYNSHNFFLS